MAIRQRLRGLLGIAVTWGLGVSVLATTILLGGLATGLIPGGVFGPRQVVTVAVRNFVAGAVAGVLFGMMLASAERRRTVATLSMRRVAGWGFLGVAIPTGIIAVIANAAVPMSIGVIGAGLLGSGVLGAALSTATLKLARRSPDNLLAGADSQSSDVTRSTIR